MISILDYGMGNLRSVMNAFDLLGIQSQVVDKVNFDSKLLIPGVGAFGAAMEQIRNYSDSILELARKEIPILGICLGQQLLFSESEEFGNHEGLGLIPGTVKYLPRVSGLKVPHVGWNKLNVLVLDPVVDHLPEESYAYFVHSLYTLPNDEKCVVASTEYGIQFPSIVRSGYVWGTQFHPEKSGEVGLSILKEFAKC